MITTRTQYEGSGAARHASHSLNLDRILQSGAMVQARFDSSRPQCAAPLWQSEQLIRSFLPTIGPSMAYLWGELAEGTE